MHLKTHSFASDLLLPSQSDVDKVALEEDLAFVSRQLREYETGEYGLREAVAEIKRRKEDIAARDRWDRRGGEEGRAVALRRQEGNTHKDRQTDRYTCTPVCAHILVYCVGVKHMH